MLSGAYQATKKDGTIYYRSNITYRNKHISLGSFATEEQAHEAYCCGAAILEGKDGIDELIDTYKSAEHPLLSFEKAVTLLNFRVHRMYIANPIFLRPKYFSYYLSVNEELKFDIDDLFFYTRHKIMRRKGHLFVNDYGMQVTLLSRYGIPSYGVADRDYLFANGDSTDWRYSNIKVINHYHGVYQIEKRGMIKYRVKIHINGNYTIGTYSSEEKAAIAYNKAVDLAKKAGFQRNFAENYIDGLSARDYADLYVKVKISQKYLEYLGLGEMEG